MRYRLMLIPVLALSLMGAGVAAPDAAPQGSGQGLAYGGDPAQQIDFWPGKIDGEMDNGSPLLIFVHGGGWKRGSKDNATGRHKAIHYQSLGYAFASIDYRLVPGASVEQQAQDVADAVAFLRKGARGLRVDPRRIVLMGHSAGAHLVALVGTDMRYFARAGLGPDAVRGIIPLDGAAYDVPGQMAQSGRFMKGTYEQAFGTDPARQEALSPTRHAGKPNAPSFLILHVDRDDGTAQSQGLAAALRRAGTPVEIAALDGRGLRGHMQINRQMGDPAYPGTTIVDAWLKRIFAQ